MDTICQSISTQQRQRNTNRAGIHFKKGCSNPVPPPIVHMELKYTDSKNLNLMNANRIQPGEQKIEIKHLQYQTN